MDPPDDLAEWLHKLVRAQAYGYGWGEVRVGFIERATAVLVQPDMLYAFSAKNQEKLVWNIANGAGEGFRLERVDLAAKLAFVDASPGFFEAFYGQLDEYSQSCDMFWDIVISTVWQSETPLRDGIFGALERQLEIPNRWCQLSALHGFNHLQDLRCRPAIDDFLKTCEDEHVRAYGKVARTFQAM